MIKSKLNDLLNEMVEEVKNLKDLTKEELPLVAKEYIKYLKYSSVIYLIFSSLSFLTSITTLFYVLFFEITSLELKTSLYYFSLIIGIVSFICLIVNIDNLLSAFLQPKRTAIYAITSLFD